MTESKKYIVIETQQINRCQYVVVANHSFHNGELQRFVDEQGLAESTIDRLPEKIVSAVTYSEEAFFNTFGNKQDLVENINNVDDDDDGKEIPF